jgi:protein phosphatase
MGFLYKNINFPAADVIGDVHGCYHELTELLKKLGYRVNVEKTRIEGMPKNRRLIFVGDFTDRGPEPVKVLMLVMDAVDSGKAFSVRGNHEEKLYYKLKKNTPAKEEVMQTIRAIRAQGNAFVKRYIDFIGRLPYVLSFNSEYLIAHAGLKEEFQKLDTTDRKTLGKIRVLAIYGDITGEFHEDGRPVRLDWAAKYNGRKAVVYGHTIVEKAFWRNNTINIDTGCFDTGILTAVRLPEREIFNNL